MQWLNTMRWSNGYQTKKIKKMLGKFISLFTFKVVKSYRVGRRKMLR